MKNISLAKLANSSGAKFGTSGVRGLVEQMTPEVCVAYTLAFFKSVGQLADKRVALGMDLRPSSPDIVRACTLAADLVGIEVVFCGVLPTPALAYYALQEGIPAIMVTGSHIPFDRNGIKFYRREGEISKSDEESITAADVDLPEELMLPDLPHASDAANICYLDRYLKFFPRNMLLGKRIGFYQHSGAARDLLTELLEKFGAEVISLGRTDMFVPIDTEAVSDQDRVKAQTWVDNFQLDALVSTDGDADRPLVGDELGNWFRGDVVGILCARYLKVRSLAIPISCTTAIEKSGWFEHVLRTRIGSPYVIEGMNKLQEQGREPVAGFEANGGFLIESWIDRDGRSLEPLPTRDAVLPILALFALAKENNSNLSELLQTLPKRFTASDRLKNFPKKSSEFLLASLEKHPEPLEMLYGPLAEYDLIDGLRLKFISGHIIHLRPSGNAPELRCYVETNSENLSKHIVAQVLNKVIISMIKQDNKMHE